MTQTLIIHVIRTKDPLHSGPGELAADVTTILIMCIRMWLPSSPFAGALGLVKLPVIYWPVLVATLFCYVC